MKLKEANKRRPDQGPCPGLFIGYFIIIYVHLSIYLLKIITYSTYILFM